MVLKQEKYLKETIMPINKSINYCAKVTVFPRNGNYFHFKLGIQIKINNPIFFLLFTFNYNKNYFNNLNIFYFKCHLFISCLACCKASDFIVILVLLLYYFCINSAVDLVRS